MVGFFEEKQIESTDWKMGHDFDEIKRIVKFFHSFDKPITGNSMAAVSNLSVVNWLNKNTLVELKESKQTYGMYALEKVGKSRSVKDFSREFKFRMLSGEFHIERIATDRPRQLVNNLKIKIGEKRTFIELWEEDDNHKEIVKLLQAKWLCSKIRSTGEIIGIYQVNGSPVSISENPTNSFSLSPLSLVFDVQKIKKVVEKVKGFETHYSNYNKRDAWSALALRGYSEDPKFIAKPTEMVRSWKKKNQEKLLWKLRDTPLRAKLPELEKVIENIPGVKHRIRLMRLLPGGGELQRHTDNSDPDAGTLDGQIMRIHVPIVTNNKVLFTVWNQRGQMIERTMPEGEAWYLDTRKPHKAVNGGNTDRIHLVMDVESNRDLRKLLG